MHCPVHIVARVAEGLMCRHFGIAVAKEWTFNLFCWDWKESIHQRYIKYKFCWYIFMSPKNEPSIFVLEIGKKKKHQTDIKTSILWIDLGLYPHTISQQTLVKIYWDLKSNMSESLADEFYSRQFRYHKWNWKFGIYPTLWWSFFYCTKIVWHLYTFALPSLYFPSDKGRQYFPKFYAPVINICLYSLL